MPPRPIIFIPGSHKRPTDYPWLVNILADLGDLYLLDNPLPSTVAGLVATSTSLSPYTHVRRSIVFGGKLDFVNSDSIDINNPLLAQFNDQYLLRHHTHPDKYLSRTTVIGHSQGAGHAAYLSKEVTMAGVIMLSGPSDNISKPNDLWTLDTFQTPTSAMRMFVHLDDRHCRQCIFHAKQLGINQIHILDHNSYPEIATSSRLIIDTRPSESLKSHYAHVTQTSYQSFNEKCLRAAVQSFYTYL